MDYTQSWYIMAYDCWPMLFLLSQVNSFHPSLLAAWYIAVQIMATVNLILTLLGMIALFVILFVRKNKCLLIFSIVSMFFCCE